MYIFDLDGTLTDSNHIWVDIDRQFLGRRGLTLTPEYAEFVAHSIFPTAAQFTRDYYHISDSAEDIMAEWRSMAREFYARQVKLKPGAKELLSRCREQGVELALFTASEPELCHAALFLHGLTPFFRHIVFAQELGVEKRDPRAFPLLGECLKVPLRDCVLFDDSPTACAAARRAGLTVIGVADSFYAASEAKVRAASHRFVTGLDQLLSGPLPLPVPAQTGGLS